MSLPTLISLRDYLSTNAPLVAWWSVHYPNAPKHYIGYKKPVNANDYPAICYVPVRDKRGGGQCYESMVVSLVVSVCEKGMSNDVFDGVARTDEAVQLIVDALLDFGCPLSVQDGVITVTTDLGINHPFYDCELQFTLLYQPQLDITSAGIGDFVSLHGSYDIEDKQSAAEHVKWGLDTPDYGISHPDLLDETDLPQ